MKKRPQQNGRFGKEVLCADPSKSIGFGHHGYHHD